MTQLTVEARRVRASWRLSLRSGPTALAPWGLALALTLMLCLLMLAAGGADAAPASASASASASTSAPSSAIAAATNPLLARVKGAGKLRVCIWPDYYGITYRDPRAQQLSGLDIGLAAALAQDLKVRVEYVDASFVTLIDDVNSGRCDVAMFAIAMLAKRAERLRFTRPYLRSDIYGITTRSNRVVRSWADIDKPGVVVGVQVGTYMEPVMTEALKHARLVVVRPPATRERELEAGRIDVFMTDYPYSRRLLDNADWAELISPPQPFHPQNYGYAVKPGDDEWFAVVDGFVQRIQRDGRLDAAAQRHGLRAIAVLR